MITGSLVLIGFTSRSWPCVFFYGSPVLETGASNWFLRHRLAVLLTFAGPGEKVDDVVIVFVTRILVHLLFWVDLDPGDPRRPWPGPGGRVLDREFVIDLVRTDARKPFGDMECCGMGPSARETNNTSEVGSLDDERN